MKGKKTMSLTYTTNTFYSSNFIVRYKYKAASQQLLDSWKDKRMTGFRLSWRIENPPLMANISEVGRSIKTPQFGDILNDTTDAPSDKLYKMTLTPPPNLRQHIATFNNRGHTSWYRIVNPKKTYSTAGTPHAD